MLSGAIAKSIAAKAVLRAFWIGLVLGGAGGGLLGLVVGSPRLEITVRHPAQAGQAGQAWVVHGNWGPPPGPYANPDRPTDSSPLLH